MSTRSATAWKPASAGTAARSTSPAPRLREVQGTKVQDGDPPRPRHGPTFTVIRVAPEEYTDLSPYAMAVVKLANGTQILTQVVDVDLDKMAIGMPVKLEFRKLRGEGEAGVLFYGYKAVPA